MNQPRIILLGKHPHAGERGVALRVEKPSVGFLPPMVRVKLDNGEECFANKEDIAIDVYTCERCGATKAHSRLKGLFCPNCKRKR